MTSTFPDMDIYFILAFNEELCFYITAFWLLLFLFFVAVLATNVILPGGRAVTVILNVYVAVSTDGLSSFTFIVTVYIPGSEEFDFGYIKKFGNFPMIKVWAPPQSIDWTDGVSSKSGSYNAGNLSGIMSKTDNFLFYKATLNFGGPV